MREEGGGRGGEEGGEKRFKSGSEFVENILDPEPQHRISVQTAWSLRQNLMCVGKTHHHNPLLTNKWCMLC